MRGNGNEEGTSVDEEQRKVSSSEDDCPPRTEEEETDSVSVRVVWVVAVTVYVSPSFLVSEPARTGSERASERARGVDDNGMINIPASHRMR